MMDFVEGMIGFKELMRRMSSNEESIGVQEIAKQLRLRKRLKGMRGVEHLIVKALRRKKYRVRHYRTEKYDRPREFVVLNG
jgi:hypothetical protein